LRALTPNVYRLSKGHLNCIGVGEEKVVSEHPEQGKKPKRILEEQAIRNKGLKKGAVKKGKSPKRTLGNKKIAWGWGVGAPSLEIIQGKGVGGGGGDLRMELGSKRSTKESPPKTNRHPPVSR